MKSNLNTNTQVKESVYLEQFRVALKYSYCKKYFEPMALVVLIRKMGKRAATVRHYCESVIHFV